MPFHTKLERRKIRKKIKLPKAKIRKAQKHSRRISKNIDGYFDESSKQIREFKFRI